MNALVSDFPEWLSPILVKELRRGLRTGAFVGAWIMAQIAVAGALIWETSRAGGAAAGTHPKGFAFQLAIGVVMWLLLPVCAASAMHAELGQGRVELLVMAGARERKICLGKWLTGVLLASLAYLSFLPYLVARYFTSRVEPMELLVFSGVILAGNAVATAIVVGATACQTWWLRLWMLMFQTGSALLCMGIATASAGSVCRMLGVSPDSIGFAIILAIYMGSMAANLIALSLSYATGKIKLRLRPYEKGTINGSAIGLFAMPAYHAIFALVTLGFGPPILALIVARSHWTDRQT